MSHQIFFALSMQPVLTSSFSSLRTQTAIRMNPEFQSAEIVRTLSGDNLLVPVLWPTQNGELTESA